MTSIYLPSRGMALAFNHVQLCRSTRQVFSGTMKRYGTECLRCCKACGTSGFCRLAGSKLIEPGSGVSLRLVTFGTRGYSAVDQECFWLHLSMVAGRPNITLIGRPDVRQQVPGPK